MKPTIQFIANIILFISYSVYQFVGMLMVGKLPKVSIYHQSHPLGCIFTFKDVFNNDKEQSRLFPSEFTKCEAAAAEFRDFLLNNEEFNNVFADVEIPIMEGKEQIGTKSIGSLLHELNKEYARSVFK